MPAATEAHHQILLAEDICVRKYPHQRIGLNQEDAESRLRRGLSTGWCFRLHASERKRNFENQGTGSYRPVGCSALWSPRHRNGRRISCGQPTTGAPYGYLLDADGRNAGGHSRMAHCHLLRSWHLNPAARWGGDWQYEKCDHQPNRYECGSPGHNRPHTTQC